jgi:LAS superfamily LD-carboxypeptidase LdcB
MKERKFKLPKWFPEVFFTILIISAFLFDGYQFWILRQDNILARSREEELDNTVSVLQKKLSQSRTEIALTLEALQNEEAKNGDFQNQIQNIASTVGVLEKLSQTDPELLKKYSKVYFLNENYIPKNLIPIEKTYLFNQNKTSQILAEVWPHLKSMMDSAKAEGVEMEILSAYRSFGEQQSLKSSYKVTYGAGTANSFSADQGYSEHQLGTTIDFTTQKIGSVLTGFDKTPAYTWLLANAYKFGFEMSYPKENSYYIFEPWHFRFVGIALATKLHDQNLYFYALDQREIDTYLVNLFP